MKMRKILAAVLALTVFCGETSLINVYNQNGHIVVNAADIENYDAASDYKYEVLDDETVTITGYSAYHTELKIPPYIDGKPVTKLGDSAFDFYFMDLAYQTQITSVVIPDTVTWIGDCCFNSQRKLSNITFPQKLDHIGYCAFNVTQWMDNQLNSSKSGIIYLSDIVIEGMNCDNNVILKNGTKGITGKAFSNSKLENIYIPSSTTDIDENAFSGCEGLTIYCEAGSYAETFAKEYGFSCVTDGSRPSVSVEPDDLFKFDLDDDGTLTISGEGKIPKETFRGNSDIKKVIIEKGITTIEESVFLNCKNLTSVTLSDSLTNIERSAFYGCSNLESVTIPDSVKSIGRLAFYNTSWLENKRKENQLVIVNGIIIDGNNCSGDLVIPDSVKSIGDSAFEYNNDLKSVTIPDSVTSIGKNAFNSCKNLESINIPDSLTSIDDEVFYGCSNLKSVTIPDSVTSIGVNAFSCCESLESITIPDSVTSIGNVAFYGCSNLKTISISNSLTSIAGGVFADCSSLESITIPDSIINMDDAFSYCKNLKSINIPDSVVSIDGAFEECTSLESITIPDSVTSIGVSTFKKCLSLKSVSIPTSVTSIGPYAFYYCPALESIIIPDSVTSISLSAFEDCSKLESITIPDSVTNIEHDAFKNTSWLDKKKNEEPLVIVNGILIDARNCSGDLIIPDSVTSIGEKAFEGADFVGTEYNCINLKSLVIPATVTKIGYSACDYCMALESVSILNPDCEIYDDESTIYNDKNGWGLCVYKGVIKGYDNSTAQKYAEKYNYTFESLGKAPETPVTTAPVQTMTAVPVTTINSVKTTSVLTQSTTNDSIKTKTESSVESVETTATTAYLLKSYDLCDNINCDLYSDGNIVLKGTGAIPDHDSPTDPPFAFDTFLKKMTISDGITRVGKSAISGANGLEAVTLSETVSSIGENAFSSSWSLKSITILNPECEIYDSASTIFNKGNYESDEPAYIFEGTIYGYDNSTAQAYAEKYNYKFESLGEVSEKHATELGDVNEDRKIDANDATLVLVNYSLLSTGEAIQLTEAQQKAADVNGDGKIDASDATMILQYYSYLSTGGDLVFKEFMKQNG